MLLKTACMLVESDVFTASYVSKIGVIFYIAKDPEKTAKLYQYLYFSIEKWIYFYTLC